MKIFFDRIFEMNEGYQEVLIDENNFSRVMYHEISQTKQNVDGLTFEDVYILQPKTYYKVELRKNTPQLNLFNPSSSWLNAGLIFSHTNNGFVYIYNSSHNHIFIRANAIIGETI